jgi:hypothetical protein
MDWLKSVSDFLGHWRGALGLFGGVATALALRKFGYLTGDVEFTAAIPGGIGFWVLVSWIGEKIYKSIRTKLRAGRLEKRRADAQRAADEAAATQRQKDEQEAAAARDRSVMNLRHLKEWELKALCWIYHQPGSRARASVHDTGIGGLYTMGLLESEGDKRQSVTDHTWRIPDHIVAVLRERLGEQEPAKFKLPAPWEGKSSGWP